METRTDITRPAETRDSIDGVNGAGNAPTVAAQECLRTELIETAVVDRPPLAYSDADVTATDFTEQSGDDPWDDDAWEDEYRAYAWGTVKIFVGLMAVVVVAAGWIVAIALMSKGHSPATDAATPESTPATEAQAPPAPPTTVTSPPTTVTSPPTTVTAPPTTVTVTQTSTPVAAPLVPTAQAPPSRTPDQIFLSEARAGGLVILDDSVAAADARQGCEYLAAGHTARETQELAMRNNPSLTWRDAEVYVRAAIDAYCPQY
ncbi:DUF732 domain-containing protein [Mycobacterium botniense]|uniref:DUF732 domain-containing protein n=1 Tax=Mycobacterium botniense TaxID=84962 RepID=A0A7I9XXU1_9MYCO|nr:DUF732 domain-containing protein [Mycobacterium botniense]GFG74619.1 hypothetical protein MBOT_19840 [Mycobacterium botniense]